MHQALTVLHCEVDLKEEEREEHYTSSNMKEGVGTRVHPVLSTVRLGG